MIDWQPRARALVQELAAQRQLADARWIDAFANVPRHVFVPRFYAEDHAVVDGEVPAQREAWLDAVYQDSTLVTQIAPVPGTDLSWSTSSSTAPSLMARMLELLDVADSDRVLEIGTGTGYNAAVLCHRLTDAQVASIDLDPILIADVRHRLATLAYRPHLVAGHGTLGIADAAPYDRIIATCAVPTIPPAWISQLTPGGLIVADVRGEIASSLLALRKTDDQTVQGRFLSSPGKLHVAARQGRQPATRRRHLRQHLDHRRHPPAHHGPRSGQLRRPEPAVRPATARPRHSGHVPHRQRRHRRDPHPR
jgi:protein-L-isoaspartate O-methyltransferase